jgi:hypothetical protein
VEIWPSSNAALPVGKVGDEPVPGSDQLA